jgi:hypothetical protein
VRRTFTGIVAFLVIAIPRAESQSTAPGPTDSIMVRCGDCGRIEAIREVQDSRANAPPSTRSEMPIGLVMYVPIGRSATPNENYVGSVGSKEWQERSSSTMYEISVRMDSGAYQVLQRRRVSDFDVDDRVKVSGGRIEHWPPK